MARRKLRSALGRFTTVSRAPGASEVGPQPLTRTSEVDAGLQQIAALEAAIVKAHDEKLMLGVNADELARQRPAVVQLAKNVGDAMRAEYEARSGKQ